MAQDSPTQLTPAESPGGFEHSGPISPHPESAQSVSSVSQPSEDDRSDEDFEESTGRTYTPEEFAEIFLNFYRFLTTLHYDEQYLKIPPSGGWTFAPDFAEKLQKSDRVVEVLRHLPYFDTRCHEHMLYKCRLIDFTTHPTDRLEDLMYCDEDGYWDLDGNEADPADVICVATGGESWGRQLFLNVKDGSVTEDMVRIDLLDPVDVREFFDDLKEKFLSLKFIACPGRLIMDEAERVPEAEPGTHITQEQVLAQKKEWITDLDIQYIRQIYREHGWPGNFQRDAVAADINELMRLLEEGGRGFWEENHW